MGKGGEASAKQTRGFAKILGKIKEGRDESDRTSEELLL